MVITSPYQVSWHNIDSNILIMEYRSWFGIKKRSLGYVPSGYVHYQYIIIHRSFYLRNILRLRNEV